MKFIRGIIGLVAAILFTIFAVANRQSVDIVWNPGASSPSHLPLYLVALGALAIGFILGALFVWISTLPVRWEKSRQKRHIKKLEKEITDYKTSNPGAPGIHPVSDPFNTGMDKSL